MVASEASNPTQKKVVSKESKTLVRVHTDMNTPTDLSSYTRVLKLASTPSREEFWQVAKIAGGGIALVGLMGFLIFVFMSFVPGGP